jgi:hypothetical protein
VAVSFIGGGNEELGYMYRITAVMKVKTDIITGITASLW